MDIEELIDEICDVFEAESDGDYGDVTTNRYIRERSIRPRLQLLMEQYEEEREGE